MGVETVRVLAGHEDLRTTQRYLHAERSDLVQGDGDVREVGRGRRLVSPLIGLATVVEMTGGPKRKPPVFGHRGSFFLRLLVGAGRFELPTSRTRTERATKLRYAPKGGGGQWSEGFDLSRIRRPVGAIFVQ